MPVDVNYFYSGRLNKIIRQTLRIFSNYQVSMGNDENGNPILKRIPCSFMSTDKSAMALLNKSSTETIAQTFPRMILCLNNVDINKDRLSGAAYEEDEQAVTEKYWNEETGNYENKIGNTYNITRLNPVPIKFTFILYICTTMQSQKFQLFEQLRSIFARPLDLQTSENALDLCRLSTIELTNINWSSRGTSSLDASQIDTMDMSFDVYTFLDLPAIVQRQYIIEQVVEEFTDNTDINDIEWYDVNDGWTRVYHTPNKVRMKIHYNEVAEKYIASIIPNGSITTWNDVFTACHIQYNPLEPNVSLHCSSNANGLNEFSFKGDLEIISSSMADAFLTLDEESLPILNVQDINCIINPHKFTPVREEGMRYLITEDLPRITPLYGEILASDEKTYPFDNINANSIIECKNNHWIVSLNPNLNPTDYFVKDLENSQYIYTFNLQNNCWVDALNKTYAPLSWKLSQKMLKK